jgi:plasmid stability protein
MGTYSAFRCRQTRLIRLHKTTITKPGNIDIGDRKTDKLAFFYEKTMLITIVTPSKKSAAPLAPPLKMKSYVTPTIATRMDPVLAAAIRGIQRKKSLRDTVMDIAQACVDGHFDAVEAAFLKFGLVISMAPPNPDMAAANSGAEVTMEPEQISEDTAAANSGAEVTMEPEQEQISEDKHLEGTRERSRENIGKILEELFAAAAEPVSEPARDYFAEKYFAEGGSEADEY